MKVKISYSVGLDEVPDKARQILYEAKSDLITASEGLTDIAPLDLYGESYEKYKESVDLVRRRLFIADAKLQDMLLILDDWKRASLALEIEKLGPPVPPEQGEEGVKDSE